MKSERSCTLDDGTERSWDHIWALDALFGVMCNHADDVATTTTKGGFSMEFRKGDMSLCAVDHIEGRPRTLFVNVAAGRELWYALSGIAHEMGLEFAEFDDTTKAGSEEAPA